MFLYFLYNFSCILTRFLIYIVGIKKDNITKIKIDYKIELSKTTLYKPCRAYLDI